MLGMAANPEADDSVFLFVRLSIRPESVGAPIYLRGVHSRDSRVSLSVSPGKEEADRQDLLTFSSYVADSAAE